VKLIAIGGQTVIEVFDLTGKKVATKTANTNAGTVNNTSVDMSRNAKGIYLVRVTNNNKVIHQRKIIKQ
jgi:sporulation protein YlmC with PRC-barrel domain